jgi:SAM-dependent methyltransferase
MQTRECIALIREGVEGHAGTWADLGSGSGAFTAALAEILGAGARLVSVDRDRRGLQAQERELPGRYPGLQLSTLAADFTSDIAMPPLDGILVANALHFQRGGACAVLLHVARWLKPGGRVVVVEYDVQRSGPWVPYPVPFDVLQEAALSAGFTAPRLLARRPSRYHGTMYSALLAAPSAESG